MIEWVTQVEAVGTRRGDFPQDAVKIFQKYMEKWGYAMIEFFADGSARVHNHIPVYVKNSICPPECFMTLVRGKNDN